MQHENAKQYQANNEIEKQKDLQRKKLENLDKALDKIRMKYGEEAVVRGGHYAGKERNEKNHPVLKGH